MPLSTSVISNFITTMEKVSTRSALSDTEKREKKIVEKKLMEMEEELKVISILVMSTVVAVLVMLKLVEMEKRLILSLTVIIMMTDNMTMLSERATITIMISLIVNQLE